MRRPHNGNHHRPVGPPAHRPAAPPRRSAPASRRAPTDNCSPAEPFSRTRREPHPRTPGWTVPGRILGGGPVMTPSATPPQQPPAAAGTAAALPHRGHPVRGGRATGAERSRTPPRRPGHRVTTDISTATTGGAGRRVTGRTAREVDNRTTRPRRGHRHAGRAHPQDAGTAGGVPAGLRRPRRPGAECRRKVGGPKCRCCSPTGDLLAG